MRREIHRKLIHVASVAAPLLVWALPTRAGITLLGSAAMVAIGIEVARYRSRWARYQFLRRTRTLLRPREKRGLAGATFMAVSYLLALLVFPKPIAVAAMLYNGLGDAAAALIGKRWGRHRTSWGKSYEGSAAALATCLVAGLLVPGVGAAAAVSGAIVATTLELLPLPVDDNVRVTLGGGAAAWAGQIIAPILTG